ncbi:MarR family winged helix-turn-helix transcriptional regulator [Actinomycetospora straminea]|uniref:MarR family transcriptional regulator n=1 Tax=Actinomycetospora straminea TaxID=663607 RepID=A0ABP9E0Y6_9PSEU|nr:MarR family winged helix-turn-helix transcriptional regulator [Actinomycetospora straminea]MDD7930997.1 MarR family winged helix-turn-helix transcriptional regulator [Actinomycetospora straminea]
MPGTQELSPSSVRAAHEVRVAIGRLRRRLRETADRDELTPSQTSLLSRLDRDGPRTASELAAAEGVRPQSVAVSVAALEERGLVTRRRDPDDGRRQTISVAPGGRAFLDSTRAAGEEWLARALHERLTEDERATVVAAMGLLDRVASR